MSIVNYHAADVELCPRCGHPTDNHDRRAEDGDCLDCGSTGPCQGDHHDPFDHEALGACEKCVADDEPEEAYEASLEVLQEQ